MANRDYGHSVSKAHHHKQQLTVNDVVVLATDGIFDNLFAEEIPQYLEPWMGNAVRYVSGRENQERRQRENGEREIEKRETGENQGRRERGAPRGRFLFVLFLALISVSRIPRPCLWFSPLVYGFFIGLPPLAMSPVWTASSLWRPRICSLSRPRWPTTARARRRSSSPVEQNVSAGSAGTWAWIGAGALSCWLQIDALEVMTPYSWCALLPPHRKPDDMCLAVALVVRQDEAVAPKSKL